MATLRKIELKFFNDDNGGELEHGYKEMIINLLRSPKNEKSVSFDEMALVIPIIQKLNESSNGSSILVEREEYDEIVARVKRGPYVASTDHVFDMINSIVDSEETEVAEVTKKSKAADSDK